jgi:hypothetical protein
MLKNQRPYRFARLFPCLFCLLSVLLLQASSQSLLAAPAQAGPTPLPPVAQADSFFGAVQAISAPDQARAAGVTWQRLVFSWRAMQPHHQHDVLTAQAFPVERVRAERVHGIDVVGVVLDTPDWAVKDHRQGARGVPVGLDQPWNSPDNVWGNFMFRLAGEYRGVVDQWVIWNEPDVYDEAGHAFWEGTPAEYARLLKVAWQAVKAANPQAKVYLAGMAYWFDHEAKRTPYLQGVLDALARDPEARANDWFFDGAIVHTYGSPLNAYTIPTLFRQLLAARGLSKPLWIGEANVVPHDDSVGKLERTAQRASLDEQAAWTLQALALARAARVERFEVYKMRDEGQDNGVHWGLVRDDGSVRPAYIAYQLAAREFANASNATLFWQGSAFPPTAEQTEAVLRSNQGRWQFIWPANLVGVRMQRADSIVTIIWNTRDRPLSVFIPSASGATRIWDKAGREVALPSSEGGFQVNLAPATHNTDTRDHAIRMIGGDPLVIVQESAAFDSGLPREADACIGAPGLGQPGWTGETGYIVSGAWLDFYQANGGLTIFGHPRSPVMVDPLDDTQCVQYFQRAVLEWHPDNPPAYQLQRRLLGELLTEPAAPPSAPPGPNGPDVWYFPKGPQGLGHAVSNTAPDGTRTGFKAFFDRYGRETTFGYPMEPPQRRDTLWTQRFQAGIMEYHAEFDRDGLKPGTGLPWRTWTVQLRLLGDEFIAQHGLALRR